MNLDEELGRLFRDERLDVPVPEGMEQAVFERVRRRRQRRRRPVWFAGGATVVVLVGGGIAFGAGLDVPLLGDENDRREPVVIREVRSAPFSSPRLVPAPLDPGTVQQFVPDPRELQNRNPQRLSPRPTQGGPMPQQPPPECAEPPLTIPFLAELSPSLDPCAPPDRDDPRIDRTPLPYGPDTDTSEPSGPPDTSEPSEPSDPPSSSFPSSSAPPTE